VFLKLDREMSKKERKKFAEEFLKEHPSVKTVLEKEGKFSGGENAETVCLRGEKTKIADYREMVGTFRFDVDTCYFSQAGLRMRTGGCADY
jgi:tRNA G37 N-methylase Trm5